MPKFRLTIRNKILVAALFIPIVALISISIYATLKLFYNVEDVKKDYAENLAFEFIDKVDRNLFERYGDVQAFASNPVAINAVVNPNNETCHQLLQYMNNMMDIYKMYDYTLVVDRSGNVICVNSKDKNFKDVNTTFLLDLNLSTETFFKHCIDAQTSERKVWYSDCLYDKKAYEINQDSSVGWGIYFASTILDEDGKAVGVWLNFANWNSIIQKTRVELSKALQDNYPNAQLILTNKSNQIIDSDLLNDKSKNLTFGLDGENPTIKGANQKNILKHRYIIGSYQSHGAYEYPGNDWKGYVLIENSYSLAQTIFFDFTGILILTLVFGAGALIISFFTANSIVNRIDLLKSSVQRLASGSVETIQIDGDDELTEMNENLALLTKNLRLKSEFASKIGNQELHAALDVASDKDDLGKSLLLMRDSLVKVAEEEKRRIWASTGMSVFNDILRHKESAEVLCSNTLTQLIKYVNANQGAVFLVNDQTNEDLFLEMKACYAYDRKKYANKKVYPKEGLVGQCYIENEYIYMTDIPNNYVYITSGTGGARPRALLLVPLKNNEHTEGVLELASFKEFKPYEIDFIIKVAELLAAIISSAKINDQTKTLLAQTQQQAEEMRAQEEEMRQNMEELLATQEEMARKQEERERQVALSQTLINTIPHPVFVKDQNGVYTMVNDAQCALLGSKSSEIIGNDDSVFIKNTSEMERIRQSDKQIITSNQKVNLPEQRLHLPDGSVKILHTSKIPYYNPVTSQTNILGISVDITESKQQQEALLAQIANLQKV